jgi:AraC-like DNA-binding protein
VRGRSEGAQANNGLLLGAASLMLAMAAPRCGCKSVLSAQVLVRDAQPPWCTPPATVLEDKRGPMGYRLSVVTANESVIVQGPALVLLLERTVARAWIETGALLVDRSSWWLVPVNASLELRAISAVLKVLELAPTPRLLRRVVQDYAKEIDAGRLEKAFARRHSLPRTVWVEELAHRYVFERTASRKRDNFVTRFCENELIKEAYFMALDAGADVPRQSLIEREPSLVENAVAWLEARLFSRWTMAQLSRSVGTSQRSLQRAFNAAHGMAPQAYARGRKLDESLLLLRSGAMTIQEVAVRVGYANTAAFSHAFTARFGHPPTRELRQRP